MNDLPTFPLPAIEPPAELLAKITGRIHATRLHQLYWRLAASAIALFGSLSYIVYSWSALKTELVQSAFFQMLRLALSDTDVLLGNLKDFGLALLETLPVTALLFGMVSLTALLLVIAMGTALRHERRLVYIR